MTGERLTLSMGEIGDLAYRATRGAGRSWAEAEEARMAAIWLARAGLDWADLLLTILRAPPGAPPRVAPGHWTGNAPLCPLRTGMALADFACLPEGPGQGPLALDPVTAPAMLLPFAARAARALGRPLMLRHADFSAHLGPEGAPALSGKVEPPGPVAVTITPAKSPEAPARWDGPQARALATGVHAELTALARGYLVPSSAQSQARAGGLGDDND